MVQLHHSPPTPNSVRLFGGKLVLESNHPLVVVLTNSGTEVTQGYTPVNNLHYYVQVYNAGGYMGAGYLSYTNYFKTEREAIASFKREVVNYGGVLSRKTAQNAGVLVEDKETYHGV